MRSDERNGWAGGASFMSTQDYTPRSRCGRERVRPDLRGQNRGVHLMRTLAKLSARTAGSDR
jgi:hypothetical protein